MRKAFDELYDDVYRKTINMIEEARKKVKKTLLIILLVLISINVIVYFIVDFKVEVTITISIAFIVMIIFIITSRNSYKKMYKQIVIENLVKSYDNNFNYYTDGIPLIEYKISNFDSSFDEYKSEDRIYGKLGTGDRFEFAEITTYRIREYKDSSGYRTEERKKTYSGMYGVVWLEKNLLSNIQIVLNSVMNKYNKDRIEVESSEFEKEYDLITKDKMIAMRIFTPDIIEEINTIKRSTNAPIEIKIDENKLFFRYKCGQMFEPPILKNDLDRDIIRNYYNLIYYPTHVLEKICENINNIAEIDNQE